MAALFKAANAKIRSNPMLSYICSTRTSAPPPPPRAERAGAVPRLSGADAFGATDFWGPVSNFGIPVAAVLDTQKSPDL